VPFAVSLRHGPAPLLVFFPENQIFCQPNSRLCVESKKMAFFSGQFFCVALSVEWRRNNQERIKELMHYKGPKRFAGLLLTGFAVLFLAACGGGGSDGSTSSGPSATPVALEPATVTGQLTTEPSVAARLMDLITPAAAIADIPATLYLDDDNTNPVFVDDQDRFTMTHVADGDHSLTIQLEDGTELIFPFRMAAGRGLDFGRMILADGQVREFNGFNGYHFGWVDENDDGINDNFVDVDGDGVADPGYRYAGYGYHMDLGFRDENRDGLNDHFADADGDGVNDLTGHRYGFGFGFIDEDGDGINDRFRDADGDGICDLSAMPFQHPFGWVDEDGDGVNDRFVDADGDGINDLMGHRYVAMPGWADLDGDGRHDFFADADGDGVNDLGNVHTPYGHGFGWVDEDGDGINDRFVDEDGDGINDLAVGPYAGKSARYGHQSRHQDDDGDGIDDVTGMTYRHGFGWVDNDGDGINDVFADSDGDGTNDVFGYQYGGGGYHMSQNFAGQPGRPETNWPGRQGGGMMR